MVLLYLATSLFLAANLQATPGRIPMRSCPKVQAPVTSLLVRNLDYEILAVRNKWLRIRQEEAVGWVRSSDLVSFPKPEKIKHESRVDRLSLSPAPGLESYGSSPSGIAGLVDFAVEDRERKAKLSDPFFRHRISQLSKEWGALFYRRTPMYYVKGIYCLTLEEGRIRLGVVKRRIFYNEIFGSLWSDEFLRSVIETNEGLLGNREIFGKGREYYVELSLHF